MTAETSPFYSKLSGTGTESYNTIVEVCLLEECNWMCTSFGIMYSLFPLKMPEFLVEYLSPEL